MAYNLPLREPMGGQRGVEIEKMEDVDTSENLLEDREEWRLRVWKIQTIQKTYWRIERSGD